jgi:hypothetical protein
VDNEKKGQTNSKTESKLLSYFNLNNKQSNAKKTEIQNKKADAIAQKPNNTYLKPNDSNSGYLDPVDSSNGYLKPIESGNGYYSDNSLAGLDVESIKPLPPPRTTIKRPFIPNINVSDSIKEVDADETEDRYLLPRQGSNVSSSTIDSTNSISSTAPLKPYSRRNFYSPTKPKILSNTYLEPTFTETNL